MMSERKILDLFKGGDSLAIIVEAGSKKPNFPTLPHRVEGLHLTDLEEQKVSKWVFGEDLKFTVPVNLRGSKKAYLSIMDDEPEREGHEEFFLRYWDLETSLTQVSTSSPDEAKA